MLSYGIWAKKSPPPHGLWMTPGGIRGAKRMVHQVGTDI